MIPMPKSIRSMPRDRFSVRLVPFKDLDPKTLASWECLEERALENNAYLSPRFVTPALRRLGSPKDLGRTVFVFVEKTAAESPELVGAGVFVRSQGTKKFPLPHLRAYGCLHSYLSGLLLDKEVAEAAARSFFKFFCGKEATWHGVAFVNCAAEGPQAELIAAVAKEFGLTWHESTRNYRAVFVPPESGDTYVRTQVAPRRIKELRRLKRRLEEQGDVRWRAFFGADVQDRSIDRFLEIEHLGWKGENRTSLRSTPSHEAFFREMIAGFRDAGKVLFTELSLGGIVIASTVNLVSGGAGFAFKVGWDPGYAKMAPGLLNELEFIRNTPAECGRLAYIDSGAEEGSFIEQLWSGRRTLNSGIFGTTAPGRMVLSGVDRLRRLKRWCRALGHSENERKGLKR